MDFRSKVLIIATIFSALLGNLPAQTNAGNVKATINKLTLMQERCKKAADFKTCVQEVNAALQAVRRETDSVQEFLEQTIKSNPQHCEALKLCAKYLGDASKALVIRDGELQMGEASYDVHTALDSVQSCQTALANGKVNIAAVSDRIKKWEALFSAAYPLVPEAENLASP